jgi:FAD/FMN-containing dehydrogenase/Fe-S oxidoreductase
VTTDARPRPATTPGPATAPGLEGRLAAAVRGRVDFSATARGLYATDASNHRHVPLGVVLPLDADDVVAAVTACHGAGVPVTMRGGGTTVAGNATGPGVVVDTSRYLTRILAVDPDARTATVEPGVIMSHLNAAVARHGLRFAPDPSTHARCTIGGMIGNDACGAHSVAWGRTADNVVSLDVVTADGTRMTVGAMTADEQAAACARPGREGEIHRALRDLVDGHLDLVRTAFPQLPRRVSGYGLDALLPERGRDVARALVGTEGTCAVVLAATVRLVPVPAAVALVVAGFDDDVAAADAVPALLPATLPEGPLAVEGMARDLVDTYVAQRPDGAAEVAALPPGDGWLFVEVGGDDPAAAADAAKRTADLLATGPGARGTAVVTDTALQARLWRIREAGAGLATRMADGAEAFPGWEDAAVPPQRLGSYLRGFRDLLARHGYRGVSYGHFGDGCVHTRIDYDVLTPQGRAGFRRFVEEAADLVVAHDGSLSGEHGDGQARSELLARMYPPEVLRLFAAFKSAWDPAGRLNPGVIVDPRPLDADMRVGARAVIPVRDVAFSYPEDRGDFARAVRRCVGVGKCRTHAGGAMCPSYRATGEEEHSTRGRAHLLLEMLEGEVVRDGWRSAEVRDALDLCLSCKACASDCPVEVDMATYKAEFLHHHYRGRLRPRAHYAMGWLPLVARVLTPLAPLVNAVAASPLKGLVSWAGGLAPERRLPRFARRTLRAWARGRGRSRPDAAERVLLWPDTFTDRLSPEVGRAATRVLEAAGYGVDLPDGWVCCGLTWVSTGQLDTARRVMRHTLRRLAPHAAAGTVVVGLEPSCTAALRKDVGELLGPDDPLAPVAEWLRTHTLTFAEALERALGRDDSWAPQVGATVLRQPHCHQYAQLGSAADHRVMARFGITATDVPAGCCGLAGNFGFERGHYEVSVAVAETATLPAVRAAAPGTVVLADGFSCRTQLDQVARRESLHLAELVDRALRPGTDHSRP